MKELKLVKIDEEKEMIYGAKGSASYSVNGLGGLDLLEEEGAGLTDPEFYEAASELEPGGIGAADAELVKNAIRAKEQS